jgi:hypothetical protein
MKKQKYRLVAVLLMTLAIKLGAQQTGDEMNSGVLYGDNWACTIQAPNGWILDNQSWIKYGVYAVFYPKGMSLRVTNKKMPIIYFKSAKLKSESNEELKAFVDYDLSNISKDKSIIITERKIKTIYPNVYYCYDIEYTKSGQYETLIYIRYKDGVHLIILTSKDKETRDNNIVNLIKVLEKLTFMNATIKN